MRLGRALWCSLLGLVLALPAQAQGAGHDTGHDTGKLLTHVAWLTEHKGYKNTPLPPALLQALGWTTERHTRWVVYQAPYDDEKYFHVFYSCRVPGTSNRQLVLVSSRKDTGRMHVFWSDPAGRLLGAAGGLKVGAAETDWNWAPISVESDDIRARFAAELDYWRIKQHDLEKLPERKP